MHQYVTIIVIHYLHNILGFRNTSNNHNNDIIYGHDKIIKISADEIISYPKIEKLNIVS